MEKFTRDQETNVYRAKEVLRQFFNTKYFDLKPFFPDGWFYGSGFLTGGAIGSILRYEEPKDYDVYFRKLVDLDLVLETFGKIKGSERALEIVKDADMIDGKLTEDQEKELEEGSGGGVTVVEGKVVTENGILLKNNIQFITLNYGDVGKVHVSFDFVHCTPWYDIEKDKLHISVEQYTLCVDKILVNNGGKVAAYREKKFLDRGYKYRYKDEACFVF